jgi:hypothetical protein
LSGLKKQIRIMHHISTPLEVNPVEVLDWLLT